MPTFRVRDENGNTHDIPAIKGEPGYTPIKGVDYLTDEELAKLEEHFYNGVADMLTAEKVGARPDTWMPTAEDVGARPDTWTPTAEEVGARPNNWMPTAEDVGALPKDWMPTAEDVGARPDTWLPTIEEIGAAPAEYGFGGQPVEIGSGLLNDENALNSALEAVYSAMKSKETKLIRFSGYPSTSDYNWFGLLSKSSDNYGSLVIHSAYDKGELLVKAKYGGSWEPVKSFSPSNFAPAGYGLGALSGKIINTDCNEATKNGWYYVSGAANAAHNTDNAMLVVAYGNNAVTQIAFMGTAYSVNTVIMIRKKTNVWQPWEYLNPPMAAGVEYRTTERWGGAPVYTKLLVCTTASDVVGNTTIEFPHGVNNIDVASTRIDITTFYDKYDVSDGVSSAWVLPYYSPIYNSQAWYIEKITDTQIKMRSEGGSSSWDAGRTINFLMKYTKKS